jgi:hypothetical protein
MVVMMVAIETRLVVMMMIMVMVLGTLTQVPFHYAYDLSSPPFFWLFPFQPLPPYINIPSLV